MAANNEKQEQNNNKKKKKKKKKVHNILLRVAWANIISTRNKAKQN